MTNIGKEIPKHATLKNNPMVLFLKRFLALEAAGGLVLMAAAVLAMLAANSSMAGSYAVFFNAPIRIEDITLAPFSLWINDGLMVVFFFMVGLEIKREILHGELSTRSKAILPVMTALGGVAVPAIIYLWFNAGTEAERGWAIPSATDIAFSLGILSLFGSRVPAALKIFLMALAVIDDLAAVIIIALFYTASLDFMALSIAAGFVVALYVLNTLDSKKIMYYIILGMGLWLSVLHSGVHATIAGVVLAFMIPGSLGEKIIDKIHGLVVFGIMPLFAFANAGVPMQNLHSSQLINPLPLGIILGLFLGKQIGIVLTAFVLNKLRLASLPSGVNWLEFYAVSILAGVGFTMSLFIGDLAFHTAREQIMEMKLGILAGSLLSAVIGCALMAIAIQTRRQNAPAN